MEVELVIHAEVMALRKGLLVVVVSRWASTHSFLFELDSKSAISWVVNPSFSPWQF